MQNVDLQTRSMGDGSARSGANDWVLSNDRRYRSFPLKCPRSASSPIGLHCAGVKGTHPRLCALCPAPRPRRGSLTSRLCSDTEMLLGCASSLTHWLMLAANRLGSQARWHRSLREHLPQTHRGEEGALRPVSAFSGRASLLPGGSVTPRWSLLRSKTD